MFLNLFDCLNNECTLHNASTPRGKLAEKDFIVIKRIFTDGNTL